VIDVPAEVAEVRRQARGGVEEMFEAREIQARLATVYARAEELVPGESRAPCAGMGEVQEGGGEDLRDGADRGFRVLSGPGSGTKRLISALQRRSFWPSTRDRDILGHHARRSSGFTRISRWLRRGHRSSRWPHQSRSCRFDRLVPAAPRPPRGTLFRADVNALIESRLPRFPTNEWIVEPRLVEGQFRGWSIVNLNPTDFWSGSRPQAGRHRHPRSTICPSNAKPKPSTPSSH